MLNLYDTLVRIIVDRERTIEAEARRAWEIKKTESRAFLLKKVSFLLSEFTRPLTDNDIDQVTFDPTCDTWRLEVGGFEFSQALNQPHIQAWLLPPICTEGCAEMISTANDLILLVSRHRSFPDHKASHATAT